MRLPFYSWFSGGLRAAPLLLTCVAVAACHPPTALAPEVVAGVKSTHVVSYIPEKNVTMAFTELGLANASTPGLLGLIESGVNASREEESNAQAKRFFNFNFRGQLWSAISTVVKETAWLKAEPVRASSLPRETVTAETVASAGKLGFTTKYHISANAKAFIVFTRLDFYSQGQGDSPAAGNYVTYSSAEIRPQEGDEAIKLWNANEGAAYRKAVDESVVESAKMLRYALRLMGGDPPAPLRRTSLKSKLFPGLMDVSMIEETEERLLFQGSSGQLYSVAARDVGFEGVPAIEARQRALQGKVPAAPAASPLPPLAPTPTDK